MTTFSSSPSNFTLYSLQRSRMASKRSAIAKNKADRSSRKWLLSLERSERPWQGLPPPAITSSMLSTFLNSLTKSSFWTFRISVYSDPPGHVRRIHRRQFLSLSMTTWCSHLTCCRSRARSKPPIPENISMTKIPVRSSSRDLSASFKASRPFSLRRRAITKPPPFSEASEAITKGSICVLQSVNLNGKRPNAVITSLIAFSSMSGRSLSPEISFHTWS